MPSLFGKSQLYKYDVTVSKNHFLALVRLPDYYFRLPSNSSSSTTWPVFSRSQQQQTIECLMNHDSLAKDCINYIVQRLHIKDSSHVGLRYYTNGRYYWLDPDCQIKKQLSKDELKPIFNFSIMFYPIQPYSIVDEKARLLIYQQIYLNFISSLYTIPANQIDSIVACCLQSLFGDKFNFEQNIGFIETLKNAVGMTDKLLESFLKSVNKIYCSLNGLDPSVAREEFIKEISELDSYGIEHFLVKSTMNTPVYIGVNYRGLHTKSTGQSSFKLDANWDNVIAINSNKQRQITISINKNNHRSSFIYYAESANYNRYCVRILNLFRNYFLKHNPQTTIKDRVSNDHNIILKITNQQLFKKNSLIHSVPDLRSSSTDAKTTPISSILSSISCHSNNSAVTTGSLPNLSIQLLTLTKQKIKQKNDVYATFSDNLNQVQTNNNDEPIVFSKKVAVEHQQVPSTDKLSCQSDLQCLPQMIYQQSDKFPIELTSLNIPSNVGLSCSLVIIGQCYSNTKLKFQQNDQQQQHPTLSPCFSCQCLKNAKHENLKRNESIRTDIIPHSTLSSTNNRTHQNSRTFLTSTSVPLETQSAGDVWLAEFVSKVESGSVYDEFDSIPLCRMDTNNLFQDGRLSENAKRNRFADVIPYNDTRVRLIPIKENLHGYINASHVKIRIQNTIYSYIATEAPLPLTISDFWRMISLNNIHVIVMLIGDLIENDQQMCAHYFPLKKDDLLRTSEFEIELISEQIRVDFIIRHFRMYAINGQRIRTVVHLQYTAWDDNQLPLECQSFIDFVNEVDCVRRYYGETNPCLVHCTAGIGRTGLFILIHVMIQCINFNKKVSVSSVLKVMREHRMSLVDRTYQYVFVYRCLITYLKSLRLI